MFTSFTTALSGLNAFSTAVDVVGNNLANLNTAGFKASTVTFQELMTESLSPGNYDTQVGFGVAAPITIRQFTQGGIQASEGPLDVAIRGDGFLVVRDEQNSTLYTRNGQLRTDNNGRLMTATGEHVQGWSVNGGVLDTSGPVGDIVVPVGTIRPPTPTSEVTVDMNLNAASAAGAPYSTSITIYDSLGKSYVAEFTFTRGADPNEWDYSVALPAEGFDTAPTALTGTLTFDSMGRLSSPAVTDDAPMLELSGFANGAADMNVSWNLFNGTAPRITQFTQPSAVSGNEQNGVAAAQLLRVGIGDGGVIIAEYSDGNQSIAGQLAMAGIRNPDSLISVGNNNLQLSAGSAMPAIGIAGTGGRGLLVGGSTEGSTVDIAKEFTNLIVFQRGYQANAKIITTVDELSQEVINLKR